MFSPSLIKKAEKILGESFQRGCRATLRSRDFAIFREKLQTEAGGKADFSDADVLELLKLAGTRVDGVVYPFKTSTSTDDAQNASVNAGEKKANVKSVRTSRAEAPKVERIPRNQIPPEIVKRIANVLYKNFKNGFSLQNASEMKRFRSLVRSLDADSVLNRESDETLRQLIAGVGRCVDGKVYIILGRVVII